MRAGYFALAAACLAFAPAAGWAANARNPYGNVNHANDAGNDTGDSQVDALNQAQLGPPAVYAAPRAYAAPYPYYYPAPTYVVPRPYYYRW